VEVTSGFGRQLWRSFVFEQRALVHEIGDVEAILPGIRVPTVVIAGTWDVIVPPSVAAAVAAAVPGAELILVARTGHFVPRDAPRVVADAVRRVEALVSAPDGSDTRGEAGGPGT
jgi:pimeloyl-ACP methyl ester carboxylesterase